MYVSHHLYNIGTLRLQFNGWSASFQKKEQYFGGRFNTSFVTYWVHETKGIVKGSDSGEVVVQADGKPHDLLEAMVRTALIRDLINDGKVSKTVVQLLLETNGNRAKNSKLRESLYQLNEYYTRYHDCGIYVEMFGRGRLSKQFKDQD